MRPLTEVIIPNPLGGYTSIAISGRTYEERFKKLVHNLYVRHGLYPRPTLLHLILHDHTSHNLNGREARWRREVMTKLGIPLMRQPRKIVLALGSKRATSYLRASLYGPPVSPKPPKKVSRGV